MANLQYKKAFTMIELILVIIIIGILAAIAIPKLTATRDDAEVVAIIANVRTVLGNFGTYYTTKGPIGWKSAKVVSATNVFLETSCGNLVSMGTELSPTEFVFCSDTKECLILNTKDEGSLTISAGDDRNDAACRPILSDTSMQNMLKKFYLGGKRVTR